MAALTTSFAIGTPVRPRRDRIYVMGYFTESPNGLGDDYGLHLAVSTDSLQWMPLNQNNPVVTPTGGTGGLRDPFILRKQDGTFVVLATDLKGTDWSLQSQYIHVWDSVDLRSFTGYRRLKLHDMATHSWAPEAYWDARRGQYGIIYSAVNSTGHNVIDGELHHRLRDRVDGPGLLRPRLRRHRRRPGRGRRRGQLPLLQEGPDAGRRQVDLPGTGSFTVFSTPVAHGGTEAPILVKSQTSSPGTSGETPTPPTVSSTPGRPATWPRAPGPRSTNGSTPSRSTPSTAPSSRSAPPSTTTSWPAYGKPSWNRIKSYNYLERLIRHVNYVAGSTPTRSTRTPTRSGSSCRGSPTAPGCPSSPSAIPRAI